MGEAILAVCHPDSITTIKHWIAIITARFEEVSVRAKQHQRRLAGALAGLTANQELLEALLSWLQWAETALTEKDKEVIPQEMEEVKALTAEHQESVPQHQARTCQQPRRESKPRIHGQTFWSANGSKSGFWPWKEEENLMMLWTDLQSRENLPTLILIFGGKSTCDG
ncbi:microtubule-actin cross-linking factor 1, isoforms 6/7-like [Alca torda]